MRDPAWKRAISRILNSPSASIYEKSVAASALTHAPRAAIPNTSDVTRFEVIKDAERVLVQYGVDVSLSLQDDDRTLKVFLKQTGPSTPPPFKLGWCVSCGPSKRWLYSPEDGKCYACGAGICLE